MSSNDLAFASRLPTDPCRLCTRPGDQSGRLCTEHAHAVALHVATVVPDPWFGFVDPAEALSRLIINQTTALAPHPARTVIEIERPDAVSAFALVPVDSDRTVWKELLSAVAADPRFAGWNVRLHDETTVLARHFASEVEEDAEDGQRPAVVCAWRQAKGIKACAIRVEHDAEAHPREAIGEAQWERLASAIRACGIDFDPVGRRLVFDGPAAAPADTDDVHPSDLAIATALLIDAGHLHPAIAEDAIIAAGVLGEGTLVSAPISLAGITRWARRYGWRLHLCDITLDEQDATGLHTWGYEHLGDLFDFWPPRHHPNGDNETPEPINTTSADSDPESALSVSDEEGTPQ